MQPSHQTAKVLPHLVVASTTLASLGSDTWRLRVPLTVTLRFEDDDEVVASWPEVEAWGAGDSPEEAINALKASIIALCEDIFDAPDETLGQLPRRWKLALEAVLHESPEAE